MEDELQELKDSAQVLWEYGYSREQAKGEGMHEAIEVLEKYHKGFLECKNFIEFLPEKEKEKLNKKLKKLELD